MEIANNDEINAASIFYRESENGDQLWRAQSSDLSTIKRLVSSATWRHQHTDWFPIDYWLGKREFVVSRSAEGTMGCLAISADPPPGAWLRLMALERKGFSSRKSFLHLAKMFDAVSDSLLLGGVKSVGWMAPIAWPAQWPEQLGFHESEQIITYQKPSFKLPSLQTVAGLVIRPGTLHDVAELAIIETQTYSPLWRHSASGLTAALSHAFSFDVAEVDGKVVGFQHSASNRGASVHLARITVDPKFQGVGIGSQLLAYAIRTYQQKGMINMTLNTESANGNAQRLYERFGYKPNGHRFPMYTLELH